MYINLCSQELKMCKRIGYYYCEELFVIKSKTRYSCISNISPIFPVFIQPYTQKRLIMYQIETVPVPILDENEQAHSYTELKIEKPYITLNEEMYITLCTLKN